MGRANAGEETYSPVEASRVLSRSGRSISERRIRQMLQAGELEGEQTEGGRWRIPRRVVHQLLTERREREQLRTEPESLPGAPESVRELMDRVAGPGEGTRAPRGASRAYGTDREHHAGGAGPAGSGAGGGEGGEAAAIRTPGGRTAAGFLVPALWRKLEGGVPLRFPALPGKHSPLHSGLTNFRELHLCEVGRKFSGSFPVSFHNGCFY